MPKKRILIIHPGNLYPTIMAFQDRVINLIRVLNNSHHVEVIALYNTEEQKSLHVEKLPEICENYYLIPKPNRTFIQKKLFGILKHLISMIFKIPAQAIYPNWPSLRNQILLIVGETEYDIIQIETWWQCQLFKKMGNNIFKVVDTHDVMYEKRELERRYKNKALTRRDKSYLLHYKQKELENTSLADLIVSISEHDSKVFQEHFPDKNHILVPIGQDLSKFINYPHDNDAKTILFYGSMGGSQNIIAFWRLYKDILPKIKEKIPDIKLIVLGANPPNEVSELADSSSIIVTGFVSDVRPYLSKSTLMVLPLETSGGFRGRIVEVMAMGIPVIGTHNALDCIDMENGLQGFISDDDNLMAEYAVRLFTDKEMLGKMQSACREFVEFKYSLEKTYGKLSKYYSKL